MTPARLAEVVPLVPAWRVDRPFDYRLPSTLAERVEVGSLVAVPFGHRNVRGIVVAIEDGPPGEGLEEVLRPVVDVPICPPPLDDLMRWVAQRYVVPLARAFDRVVPARVRVKAPPARSLGGGPPSERIAAYEGGGELIEAIESGATGVWSLRADPNDARGDLIAELVAAAGRAEQGAALVAVPEVRYGSRVLDSLQRRWPEMARVDTSQPDADRARAWLQVASGHGLAGGGRATVFAPAPRLRLVVIDEEHHPTYKEDRAPRYDARRVAVERARLQGALCVMVSSTPSVAVGGAVLAGNFHHASPARQAVKDSRPVVEVFTPTGDRALSHELHQRMAATLAADRRIGLLVPRRGYARILWCAGCRRSLRCPRCEAGLFYERTPRRVRCIRCAWESHAPDVCPSCGASDWRAMGAGSERLAEQVAAAFPRARVRRVDPEVIDEAPGDDCDIYVTTWIGTKPEVRPAVSLVGVLDADALVRKADFRAAENAYHAFSEMAAWAGPAERGGRLVIQSTEPAHHAIQAVVRGDYDFFLERELAHRSELGYPPYSELVKVDAAGPVRDELIRRAAEVCRSHGATVLGPITVRAAGSAGAGGERLEILAKCPKAQPVARDLRDILASASRHDRLRVDVDPG